MNENHICPICGGELVSEVLMNEKKDACYYKVKSRYKVWPSAYASGALVKCRKKGAKNWGTKSEGFEEVDEACWKGYHKEGMKTMFGKKYPNCVKNKKTNEGPEVEEGARIARKPGQPANSKKHSDLYTDENPKGTITGLKFATAEDARASVSKIRKSGRSHAHKIQAAVAMEQRAKAAGKAEAASVYRKYINATKKNEEQIMKEEQLRKIIREAIEEIYKEEQAQQDECLECYEAAMEEGTNEAYEECYKKINWNIVPEGEEHTCEGDEFYEIYGDINADAKENLEEAEYRGRKVKLGKPMRGDVKKFKVYIRNPQTGKVKKVNFGDKKMRIKKSNPKRRKSFRARHNCANPGPRTKARYWSCRKW